MRASATLVLLAGAVAVAAAGRPTLKAEGLPAFRDVLVDPELGKICYAVALADVDGDGRDDIVAVSEDHVWWYQNPTWQRRAIVAGQTPRDNVCIAPFDVDGDGQIDFALGAGWTSAGSVHWLRRGASLDEPWEVREVARERWVHRMRWADVLGRGRPQLVVSPLNASAAAGVRLTAFELPADPLHDRWPPTVLDNQLDAMHNHWHADLDGDGTPDTLTASRQGLHLVRKTADGWRRDPLGPGATGSQPAQNGAGEIKAGRLSGGATFLVTVEPMHGDTLAVYTSAAPADRPWSRRVVDHGFRRGHALATADFDGDGVDEIVFGHSDTPETFGVIVYRARDAAGGSWEKRVVDSGGMATEDLVVGDLTGDGRPDIVAGGRATHNVKLYVNGQ